MEESAVKKYLGLLLLPVYLLMKTKWIWRKEHKVTYNFDTIDPNYFNRWFAPLYDRLNGTKRITPRVRVDFGGREVTEAKDSSVALQDLFLLFPFAATVFPPLVFFCLRTRVNLIRNYTAAVKNFILFNGYFRRYPCHHFITYADEGNHPCRYVAFRRNCSGDFIVIQNGERTYHPMFAYGMTDRYFVFGQAQVKILKDLRVRAKQFEPVGALYLNEYFDQLRDDFQRKDEDCLYDILFVDQSIYPFNGFTKRSGQALEKILEHLNELKRRHPEFRIAYQLRNYGTDLKLKNAVLNRLGQLFTEKIEMLDHQGLGNLASYQNLFRTNLIVTFESTLGFEALRLGRKVLFVNYSGDPSETLCTDERFQIEDETADFDNFERHVLYLLQMRLTEIPEVALERHLAFDGKVQERILSYLTKGGNPVWTS